LRLYLDTSVLTVYLFGRDKEPNRYSHTVRLFDEIDAGQADGLISLYALQEIFAFCQDNFSEEDIEEITDLAFRHLFQNRLRVCGMLTRQQKVLNARRFLIEDPSDLPHAIVAYLQKCDALVTYDRHFDSIADRLTVVDPQEWAASQFGS
jgi:predicted nucleic acid-binding protein